MLNKQSKVVIKLFQDAFQEEIIEHDPEKYLQEHRTTIIELGRPFEFLGLAKRNRRSPLGWKPTAKLLDLISNRWHHRNLIKKKKSCLIDKFFFYDLIMYTMLGPCDCFFGRLDGFLSLTDTLEELGLVFVEPENENVVRLSHLFCDLFARGYDRWA
jgi:hypothetical protein